MNTSQHPDFDQANTSSCSQESIELYRTADELGEIIVTQQADKRLLGFASALQQSSLLVTQPEKLVHEYTQIMLLSLLFNTPRHITVLGLGGGGLAHCLQYYFPHVTLQLVELRQVVIDIAYQWFKLPISPQLKVSCADAGDYLLNAADTSTDLIMSDLYEADGMSELQAQVSFINNAQRVLNHNGWLVINFHQLPDDSSVVMQQIKQQFNALYVCDVFNGNWVVFCAKSDTEVNDRALKSVARSLGQKMDIPFVYYYKQLRKLC